MCENIRSKSATERKAIVETHHLCFKSWNSATAALYME